MLHLVFIYCLPVVLVKALCLKIGMRIARIQGAFWKTLLIASVSLTAGWLAPLLGLVSVPIIDLVLMYVLTDAVRNKYPFAGVLIVIIIDGLMFLAMPYWDKLFL